MSFPVHSFRELRHSALSLVLLIALAGIAGCGSDKSSGGMVSPPGWVVVPSGGQHATSATLTYIANGGTSSCAECHGADLSGGTSKVSCFENPAGCHHGAVANWATPAVHGATAKQAPSSPRFASCQLCHGADFRTPRGDGNSTCYSCHSLAPHPDRPWRSSTGSTHTNSDPSNAPVCYRCHAYTGTANPNNPHVPPTPAPTGTAPGCNNGTMCHNQPASHPAGWVATAPASQPHANDAKATPGATTGFTYCQVCHGTGTDFAGGSSGVSCYPCHSTTTNSPHASAWRTGDTYVHTTTAEGNASACAFCHLNGVNSPIPSPSPPAPAGTAPGCFNNTLCHGAGGAPHPLGSAWVATSPAAQPHGNSAKATPGGTAGFPYCQVCHGTGTNFAGGTSGVSCYPCHSTATNSPHASQWRTGDTYVHTTTAEGNASACAFCHLNGANSPIAAPSPPAPVGTAAGCFNNTLCHNGGAGGVPHAVPYNDPAHFGVTAATFPAGCGACHDISAPSTKAGPVCRTCHVAASPLTAANCTSCHSSPPNGGTGATYANIAGAHSVHLGLNSTGSPVSCNTCHNALGPSLLDNNHYNRAKSRVEPGDVAFLTTYNAESGTSSFNSAAFSCSNVSCHGGVARSGGNPGTPLNWRTGTLTVNTACTSCHNSGTAQFNSYNSGEHQFHVVGEGISCTACHNTTTLAVNHFTNLGTTAMEGPASVTIGGGGTSIPAGNYNGISCDPRCHNRRNW